MDAAPAALPKLEDSDVVVGEPRAEVLLHFRALWESAPDEYRARVKKIVRHFYVAFIVSVMLEY